MDFRGVEHGNRVFASLGDFSSPRIISSADQIPAIGPFGFEASPKPIRLRRVIDGQSRAFVVSRRAFRLYDGWAVDRTDPFPFDLGEHLPRMAQRSVSPEITDMIPEASWKWSLARMMVRSDWDAIVDEVVAMERVCVECGSTPVVAKDPKVKWAKDPATKRLDGHEVWSFNGTEQTGFFNEGYAIPGVQRLVAIQPLCGRCHETKHVGNALHRHPKIFERAFARLGAINRISFDAAPRGEAAAYLTEIRAKYSTRNRARKFWAMDFAALGGRDLRMAAGIFHAGECLVGRRGRNGAVEHVRVLNADLREEGGRLIVRPHGWTTPRS